MASLFYIQIPPKSLVEFWMYSIPRSPIKAQRTEKRFQMLPIAEEKNLKFEVSQISCPLKQRNHYASKEHKAIQTTTYQSQRTIQNIIYKKKRESMICSQEKSQSMEINFRII